MHISITICAWSNDVVALIIRPTSLSELGERPAVGINVVVTNSRENDAVAYLVNDVTQVVVALLDDFRFAEKFLNPAILVQVEWSKMSSRHYNSKVPIIIIPNGSNKMVQFTLTTNILYVNVAFTADFNASRLTSSYTNKMIFVSTKMPPLV